jgi:hypothetical protein
MSLLKNNKPRKRSDSHVNSKKKSKISDDDFYILDFYEYENIQKINYNIKQLKEICKYYKLKISGNKNELNNRVYDYLKRSNSVVKIQCNFRKYLCKLSISLRGPALFDRSISTNHNDFYTFDSISSLSFYNFISWREDKNIFSFDIYSLHELVKNTMKNKKSNQEKIKALNPYNRSEIPEKIVKNLMQIIRLNKIHGENFIVNKINEDNQITITTFNDKILDVCLRIDSLGNYTDVNWFKSLNRRQIIKFINVLHDIWNYRAQIPENVKREISAPVGRPFAFVNSNYHYLCNADILSVKMIFIKIVENFINKGINDSSSSLGAMYVLSALTLVNEDAANAMPWLFQSVAL